MTTQSSSSDKLISRQQAVEEVLAQLEGPITFDELTERVLVIRPSKAKNPKASLRNHLRWDHVGKTLVFVEPQVLLPLRLAMQGLRFRIPLSFPEVKRKVLYVRPAFDAFLRQEIDAQAVQLLDQEGRPLPVSVVTIRQDLRSPFGLYTMEHTAFELKAWFRAHRIRRDDSVLVTIEDWEASRFRLEHEPAGQRRQEEIAPKNQELADLLFSLLEAARNEMLITHRAIPTAYARLSDPRGYPGDHWLTVLEEDPRMQVDEWSIRYSDFRSPLEDALYGAVEPAEESFTPDQARQVYRFKAALWHRQGLWRRIEIQGGQTLGEFDWILRLAFEHDTYDHLSGFWKRIRRGKGKRFREVGLGNINPFEGGGAADLHVAGLGLQPRNELKYVYDFGDWIEHRITLEAIVEPEAEVEYPRIVAQNKPRYRNCVSCREAGRKSRATWICIGCSNREEHAVLLCEDCLMQDHEGHYADEILY